MQPASGRWRLAGVGSNTGNSGLPVHLMQATLQDVFQQHFGQYAKGRVLHPREYRAAYCISQCYQPALGMHVLACAQGHVNSTQYHACGHRTCPRCAGAARQQWLTSQLSKLLPCPHFHVIFTLPHVFLALWQFNRAVLAQLLFDCARSSLLDLCADARHLGAMPGLLMALHTWGRNLSHHPHMHCLVSAGGLDNSGQWRACRPNFLLPLEPLRRLFRGKLLCALQRALANKQLNLPPLQDSAYWQSVINLQWHTHWNIQINQPYAHGRGVAIYLARYVKGGPLGSDRRLHLTGNTVSFAYFDHADAKRKNLTLTAPEFISRVLWHAPPKGQHTVRHAGLYASAHLRQHQLAFQCLAPTPPPPQPLTLASHAINTQTPTHPVCSVCAAPLRRLFVRPPMHQSGEFFKPDATRPSHLGPTGRCNGHLTGGRATPPKNCQRGPPACQMPLN